MIDRKSISPDAARRRAISAMSAARDHPREFVAGNTGAYDEVIPDLTPNLAQHLEPKRIRFSSSRRSRRAAG